MTLSYNKKDAAHARIYHEWMSLPAWRELSPHSRALLVEILTRYRPKAPNAFPISLSEVMNILRCSRQKAHNTLIELTDLGWLDVERHGSIKGKKSHRTGVYSLTAFPNDTGAATHSYQSFTLNGLK